MEVILLNSDTLVCCDRTREHTYSSLYDSQDNFVQFSGWTDAEVHKKTTYT